MQISKSNKDIEHFNYPICREEIDENNESCWIYVTAPRRHAYCLVCLNTYFKNRAPIYILDNTSLPGDWKECYHIEEAESNEYSVILSSVKEDSNENVQIGEF